MRSCVCVFKQKNTYIRKYKLYIRVNTYISTHNNNYYSILYMYTFKYKQYFTCLYINIYIYITDIEK